MRRDGILTSIVSLLTGLCLSFLMGAAPAHAQDTTLAGLWYARQWYGPDLRGELVLERTATGWRASVAGRRTAAQVDGDSARFTFPSGGTFAGRLVNKGRSVAGHWTQGSLISTGSGPATPLILSRCGADCYSAMLRPMEDVFTYYMNVVRRADGRSATFLRNPERNQGRFIPVSHITRRGDSVHLRNAADSVVVAGVLRNGMITLPLRGGAFDFRRVHPDSFTHFYPRGRPTANYVYEKPRQRTDGWPVATPEDVGLSREKLEDLVRFVANASVDSMQAHRLHGILVARDGKLVLEEYFFGEHGDKPHDTRSGSKTFVTAVLGAAQYAGVKISSATPVYAVMGLDSAMLDPRKRVMTLAHLLTMSSGLDCDDSASTQHPGSENVLTNQTDPDWLRTILGLKMLRDPGAQFIYCSINAHLASEVVARAARRPFVDLFAELIAAPLDMGHYHVGLTPFGSAYMGGGIRLLPRDYMKLAQMYANGGTWKGRRILSKEWVDESIKPRFPAGTWASYGYLWWSIEYVVGGRRVRGYFATGNGGQISMFIPELGLVIAAFGGNYSDASANFTARTFIPRHVLPAVVK
jgi:CubicO group peptidase (beta-lactamase class C family)